MKFNELYGQYMDEASVLDPVRPTEMKRTKSGHDRKTTFRTPAGNKVEVIFKEYPNNEAELSFKVNGDTNADPNRKYDKDIARMVIWVVREELKDSKYDEIGILPEYDKVDRTGLQRKKNFINIIKKYITNYEVVDYDEEESDFTLVPKDKENISEENELEVKCGWCDKHMGYKDDPSKKGKRVVSHGICPKCRDKFLKDLDKEKKK